MASQPRNGDVLGETSWLFVLIFTGHYGLMIPSVQKGSQGPYFRIPLRILEVGVDLTNYSVFRQLFLFFPPTQRYNRAHNLIHSLNYVLAEL